MKKLTFEEIILVLKSLVKDPIYFLEFEDRVDSEDINTKEIVKNLGKMTVIDSGFPTVVLYFKNHNVYIRINGEWDSYEGYYPLVWDSNEIYQVTPVTKTITCYERKKV